MDGNFDDLLNEVDEVLDKPKPLPKPVAPKIEPSGSSRADAVRRAAQNLGIDPLDYATVISYETAGTFDPQQPGPRTKWGQHRGTIQYGEPQAKRYGVHKDQTFEDQVENSNVRYLKDRGVKPGDDILRIYKAINGGDVNVSDNVRDINGSQVEHVARMMRDHRRKAEKFLGGRNQFSGAEDYTKLLSEVDSILGQNDYSQLTNEVDSVLAPTNVGAGLTVDTDLRTGLPVPKQMGNAPTNTAPSLPIPDYSDLLKEVDSVIGETQTLGEIPGTENVFPTPTVQTPQTIADLEPAQSLPPDYAEYLKARELPDSQELRNEYSQTMKDAPESFQPVPTVQPNGARQQNPINTAQDPGRQQATSFTQDAPDSLKAGTYDNIREGENSGQRISIDLSNVSGDKNAYINAETAKQIAQQYNVSESDALEVLNKYPLMRGDGVAYSPEEVAQKQSANFRITKDLIEEIRQSAESKNPPIVLPKGEIDAEAEPDTQLRARARDNVVNSPLTLGSDAEIEEEYQALKNAQLDEDSAATARGDAASLNENLGNVGASAVGGIARGVAGINRSVAGIFRAVGFDSGYNLFSKIAQKSQILSDKTGDDGTVTQLIKIAGSAPFDVARLGVLSRIPGGMIAGFAADGALQSAGQGESVDQIAKAGIKGAVIGGVFGAAKPIAGAVGSTFRKNAINFVDAFPSNAAYKAVNAATSIIKEGTEIGTIVGGTLGVEKFSGATDKEAARSAILNAIFHISNKAGGKAFDKIYKIWENGKANDVYVDKNGRVKLLKGEVEPNYVDAEIITDPKSLAYSKSEAARNVTPGREVEPAPLKRIGETDAPRELAATNPLRAESADPTALQKISVDSRAQKVIENIKDGKVYTIEQLQKSTRINPKNLEDTILNLYGARQIEINADNSIRFIGNESANSNLSLYERVKQNETNSKIQPQPPSVQADNVLPSTEVSPSQKVENRSKEIDVENNSQVPDLSIYEALPQQKTQEAAVEKPKASLDYAERPNTAEKLKVFTERGRQASIEPKVVEQKDLLTSLDEGYPQEFQPRDRSRAASKAQISEIAGRLNPEFLGDSPKASDGRPLVVPVQMPNGQTKYAVISGNGRTAGIREAYNLENEGAGKYKEFVNSKGGENLNQPVYVGILDPNEIDNFSEFAKESNESATQQMSASEQAKSDADRLDASVLNLFVPSEDGTIHGAANRDFVRAFLDKTTSTSERNRFVDSEGKLNQEGVIRVKNAVFAKAFGNSEMGMATLQRMAESTDSNIKNITNALLAKAGELSSFSEATKDNRRHKQTDIAPDFARAMEKYSELKESGTSIDEYVRQGALFGADTSPLQTRVMQVFDHYKRRSKSIKTIIDNYLAAAEAIGDPKQIGLFGQSSIPSKESIFEGAVKDYEKFDTGEESGEQVSLLDTNQGRENKSDSRSESNASVSEVEKRESDLEPAKDLFKSERERFKKQVDSLEYQSPQSNLIVRLNADGSYKDSGRYNDGSWSSVSEFGKQAVENSKGSDYQSVKKVFEQDVKGYNILKSDLANSINKLISSLGGVDKFRDLLSNHSYEERGSVGRISSDAGVANWLLNSQPKKDSIEKIVNDALNADKTQKKESGQNRVDAPLYQKSETLLAPNGEQSNLTPFQHAQVRTKAFKDWFGDWENNPESASQMVDRNGEPAVFHHGSKNQFESFSKNKFASATDAGWLGEGFYFYDNANLDQAQQYGDVTSVYLNIRDPYYASGEDVSRLSDLDDIETSKEFSAELKDNWHDGVYYNGDLRGETVVFEPNQIKSAFHNNGEFSPANDSILYRKPTTVAEKIEAKRAERLTDDLRKTVESEFTLDSLRRTKIHPDGRLNPEAYQIMAHAHAAAFGHSGAESFRGVFLNPEAVKTVRTELANILGGYTNPTAKFFVRKLLAQYDAAIKPNGAMIQIVTSESAPNGLKSAWQEEQAHEFDYFQGKNHDVASRAIFNDSIGNQAMRALSAEGGNYRGSSPKTLATEVAAKVWVDGNDELGLSSEQVESLQDVVYNAWNNSGISENEIINFLENISESGQKYAERKTGQSSFTGTPRNSREINTGRASANDSQYQESGRTEQRQTATAPRRAETQFDSRAGKNRQDQNLTTTESAFIERQFKGNKEFQSLAKDEILYARAKREPTTKAGSALMKVGRGALDVVSAPKSLMSSVDISAAGRQGLIVSLANPGIAKNAFVQQLKSFKQSNYDKFVKDLNIHPAIEDAEAGDLYLSTLANQTELGQREESFMSRLMGEEKLFENKTGEKVRKILTFHVRASERAYVTYLDSIRINTFAKLVKAADAYNARNNSSPDKIIDAENNITHREDQLTAIGQFINYATGRGSLGKFEDAAPILNGLFFSPRFLMSRLQLLNPRFYSKLPPGVRNSVIKQMLTYAAGTAIALALLKISGADVEIGDPENPDFLLKAKFGNYHYDFGGGMAQPIRYITRMVLSATGRLKGEKQGFGEAKESALTKQFLRSKLSPAIGSAVNLYSGKNMIGEESTIGGEAGNLMSPMIVGDVKKTFETDGSLGIVKTLPSLLGIGTSFYEKKGAKATPEMKNKQLETLRNILEKTKNPTVKENLEKRIQELEGNTIRPFADFSNVRRSENVEDVRNMDITRSRERLERWKNQRQSENVIDARNPQVALMMRASGDSQSVMEIFDNAEEDDKKAMLPVLRDEAERTKNKADKRLYDQAIKKHLETVKNADELRRQGVAVAF